MTEVEWLLCENPDSMLWFISGHPDAEKLWSNRARPAARKWRLLGVACCRRIWTRITEAECRLVVDVVEAIADGEASEAKLQTVAAAAVDCGYRIDHDRCLHRAYAATDALGRGVGLDATLEHSCSVAVGHAAWAVGDKRASEMRAQSALARCIFGNPFRPVAVDPVWLTWNNGTVSKVAQAIYTDRDFHSLPILADALEEAGCADAEILAHLRGPGPHVRGCWAVDLCLGLN